MIPKLAYGEVSSIDRITRLIFFEDTFNSEMYMKQILQPFFEWLIDEDYWYVFFKQDSAIAYSARSSMDTLR
jgi:hypothetical protein